MRSVAGRFFQSTDLPTLKRSHSLCEAVRGSWERQAGEAKPGGSSSSPGGRGVGSWRLRVIWTHPEDELLMVGAAGLAGTSPDDRGLAAVVARLEARLEETAAGAVPVQLHDVAGLLVAGVAAVAAVAVHRPIMLLARMHVKRETPRGPGCSPRASW